MYTQANTDTTNLTRAETLEFIRQGAEQIQDNKIAADELAWNTINDTVPPTFNCRCVPTSHKTCTKCNQTKPVSAFYGKQTKCKPCHKAQVQARQHANAVPTVYGIVIDCRVVYVGSTYKLSLTKRLEAHWSRARTGASSRIARALREAQRGNQAVSIVVLEAMERATKAALLKKERVWIRRFSRLTNNSLCQVRSVPVVQLKP